MCLAMLYDDHQPLSMVSKPCKAQHKHSTQCSSGMLWGVETASCLLTFETTGESVSLESVWHEQQVHQQVQV